MGAKKPVVKTASLPAKPPLNSNWRAGLMMLVLIAPVPLLALAAVGEFATTGVLEWTGLYALLSAVWAWAILPSVVTIGLSLYLNSQLSNRNYLAVDAAYSRALRFLQMTHPMSHGLESTLLSNIGLVRLCQGYYESAEVLFRQATDAARKNKHASKQIYFSILLNNIAVACVRQNKLVESELYATEGLEFVMGHKDEKRKLFYAAPLNAVIGATRLRLGELASAEEYLLKAKRLYESAQVPYEMLDTAIDQASTMCNLGLALVYARMKQWDKAEALTKSAIAYIHSKPKTIGSPAIEGLNLLADEYMSEKRYERAEQLIEIAYPVGKQFPFHPDAQATLKCYEQLLIATDRQTEIADMKSWLRDTALRIEQT